jgi:hypothetical protein
MAMLKLAVLALIAACAVMVPTSPAHALGPGVEADFNGDGIADLAIGVPDEDVGSITDAGAVNVIYGSLSGLSDAGNQLWTQDSTMGVSEPGDHFGAALATGDFNGDGFADLAIGASGDDLEFGFPVPTTVVDAGAVNVLYGSDKVGLTKEGQQLLTQGAFVGGGPVEDRPETGDAFGAALAAGDFGKHPAKTLFPPSDDLAVGAPGETIETLRGGLPDFIVGAGAVNVLYGHSWTGGLTGRDDQFWTQCLRTCPLADAAEDGDGFGSSLAAANFGMSELADLAVGIPFEDLGSVADAGAVHVLPGSQALGLTGGGSQMFTQDNLVDEAGDASEAFDQFGWSVAGGDFNGDGIDELAVGSPFEDLEVAAGAGAVDVVTGTPAGLSYMADRFWTQDDIGSASEVADHFGWSLATGDFGRSNYVDLAVGVPGEDLPPLLNPIIDGGGVNVMYGSATGLSDVGVQFWSQDTLTVTDDAEPFDRFGSALSAAQFGLGPESDLAVGVPLESISDVSGAGAVNVLYGSSGGVTDAGNQLWHQDSPGIMETAEQGDHFGEALMKSSHG